MAVRGRGRRCRLFARLLSDLHGGGAGSFRAGNRLCQPGAGHGAI